MKISIMGRGSGTCMKILVGSKNPGKIAGAEEAFLKFFKECEIEGIRSKFRCQ